MGQTGQQVLTAMGEIMEIWTRRSSTLCKITKGKKRYGPNWATGFNCHGKNYGDLCRDGNIVFCSDYNGI